MTDPNVDTTAQGDLVQLTDDDLDRAGGGIIPILVAAGGFVAANSSFFVAAGAGAGLVLGFWWCATHYKNN